MAVDMEYLEQYLHKRRKESIFDIEEKNYYYIRRIVSWSFNDNTINLNCETDGKHKILVKIRFCSDKVFCLTASIGEEPIEDKKTKMIVGILWGKPRISVKESENQIIAKTKSITVLISKDPWYISIYDNKGKLITKEHTDGIQKKFFPVYPLGFALDKDGQRSMYESMDLYVDEHLYGLGEKFSSLDKRGQKVSSWNSDTTLVTTDRAYKNIPFFMSTRGYGIFINSSHKILYEMGSDSFVSHSFEVKNTQIEYYFIYGPSVTKILDIYTSITGKAPMPPKWSFGLWMSRASYKNREEVKKVAGELREYKIPCDVIHIDPAWMNPGHYCDLQWNEKSFPNPKEMIANLKKKGLKLCLWEQPYVPVETAMFKEGEKKGFFIKNKENKPYIIPVVGAKQAGIVDFTNPEAVAWYQNKHRKLLEMGVSVFKTDMSEAVPEDSIFFNGKTGYEMHNLYPLLYNHTVWEVSKRYSPNNALVWGRAGYAGSQRYPVCWSGDSHTTFLDMACVLRGGLSLGLSGIPFWSHDIGGFQGPHPSSNLYIRWAQLGLFSSHSRCHGGTPREPWEYGEKTLNIFRKYAQLRYRLIPYIYSYAYIASKSGLPIVRPLILEFQNDPNVYSIDTEYMFGKEFLVAPIFDESGKRNIYLPKGKWIDYWTKEEYSGSRNITYNAPLDILPIFVREDSIIPMGPIMNYVGEKPFDPILLDIYLYRKAKFVLYDEHNTTMKFETEKTNRKITININTHYKNNFILIFNKITIPKRVLLNRRIVNSAKIYKDFMQVKEGWFYGKDKLEIKFSLKGPAVVEIM